MRPSLGIQTGSWDLAADSAESTDRYATADAARKGRMMRALEAWLASVVRSLNGADYGAPAR